MGRVAWDPPTEAAVSVVPNTAPFEDREPAAKPEVKIVPLVKQGRLRYWQTGASPVQDKDGNIMTTLNGDRCNQAEQMHRAALEAPNVEARAWRPPWGKYACGAMLAPGSIDCAPEESAQGGEILVGRAEAGQSQPPILSVQWQGKDDWYSSRTLAAQSPLIYRKIAHCKVPLEPALVNDTIEEWLEVPLRTTEGHVIGKITIDNRLKPDEERPDRPSGPRPITNEHFADLLIVAGYAANAIWEARRHGRTDAAWPCSANSGS